MIEGGSTHALQDQPLGADGSVSRWRRWLLIGLVILMTGFLIGVAFQSRGRFSIRDVQGTLVYLGPHSACIARTALSGSQCEELRLSEQNAQELPSVGSRVRGGFVKLPSVGRGKIGSWVYIRPAYLVSQPASALPNAVGQADLGPRPSPRSRQHPTPRAP